MMPNRAYPVFAVVALAATLWIVPSIGSQGMGTIGERFNHADRSLLEATVADAPMRAALRGADAQVEGALRHSPPVD